MQIMGRIEFDLDVLKPHIPSNYGLAQALEEVPGVFYVQIKTDEIDQKTTSIFITIKGTEELSLEAIKEKLESMNCALHSVDRVQIDKRT
ncbi:MAG: hypothetical protein E3J90_01795 [Promethearchaeota archaeon]|nr:MAG: hypothetical protein E3J90_01795 [Candidatus Lokiarchaeota archaeon]